MKQPYFAIFAFTIFVACNAEPNAQEAPAEVAEVNEAAPTVDSPATEWPGFWSNFKLAIRDRKNRQLADMTVFPLRGSEAWAESGSSDLGPTHLFDHFDEIFDAKVQDKFARATDQDFMTLKAENEEHAKLLNVPIGTEVKAIHVVYVFDAGTPEQTESSLIFNFAKVDGEYKFVSIMSAG